MKKIYLLFISLLLVITAQAQPCNFNYTIVQANTVDFIPPANYAPPGYYYHWDFGDGSSMFTGANSHVYAQGGTYNVVLDVYDINTSNIVCSSTSSFTLTFCSFGFQQDSINPSVFHFWANNVPANNSIQWDFGDGNSGTGTITSHGYAAAGTYTVYMTQIDSSGNSFICSTSFMVAFNFLLPCSFNITSNPGTTVYTLDALVASSLGTVIWDLGDTNMGPAYGYNAQVAYGSAGTYTICMTYISPAGDTCQYCQQVTVGGGSNCAFTYVPDPNNPYQYTFTGSPTSAANIYLWDFGDGSTGTSSVSAITHTYNSSGIFQVCMYITDTATSNTVCSSCSPVMINNPVLPCQANFTYANVGLTAYFINQTNVANPAMYNYLWDFGDGMTSTLPFPQHVYGQTGKFWVCLNVSSGSCNNTFCDSVTIDTLNNTMGCSAYFVFTSNAPYSVIGVNLSSGTNLTFAWDFGDGQTGTGAYPSHQYVNTGTYIVCLTVTGFGCTDTYCDTLTVDSLGNVVYKGVSTGFTLNIMSPADVTTAVNEVAAEKITRIYPVPVNDFLYVDQLPSIISTTYEVFGSRWKKSFIRQSYRNKR
jgi:PKD repeat protein